VWGSPHHVHVCFFTFITSASKILTYSGSMSSIRRQLKSSTSGWRVYISDDYTALSSGLWIRPHSGLCRDMRGALSLQAITSRLRNFLHQCLPLQLESTYFLFCSVDAVWVPGTRPAATKSTVSEMWKPVFESTGMLFFFGVFQRRPQTTGLGLLQDCFATLWHHKTSWAAAGEARHGGKLPTCKQFVFWGNAALKSAPN